jgi:hypothetical protein
MFTRLLRRTVFFALLSATCISGTVSAASYPDRPMA